MQTIDQEFHTITEVKRSKFFTFLVPIDVEKIVHARLKKAHPKANHIVYALRSINHYDQIVENSTDDGEPKGCAGLPTLNVLRGEEMVNCVLFIVRYFGGIKLGTGGMARAYAQSAKDVIAISERLGYSKQVDYVFKTSYKEGDKVLYLLKKLALDHYERVFDITEVIWTVTGNSEAIEKLKTHYA